MEISSSYSVKFGSGLQCHPENLLGQPDIEFVELTEFYLITKYYNQG